MAESAQVERIEMQKDKECKGSVRYIAGKGNLDAVVSNVYLSRSFSRPMPDAFTVTIAAKK